MGRTDLRLLYLNHNVAYSGTFFRAFHLGRRLAARGHTVTLVTTSRVARFQMRSDERDGLELVEAPDFLWGPARTGWDPWNTLRRIAFVRGREYDVVHAFDSRPAVILPALAAERFAGAALFMDWADWWGRGGTIEERSGWVVRTFFGPVETWFEETFRIRAAGSTVISRALEERAAALGVPRARILRIPHGCDVDGLVPASRPEARAVLGVAADVPLLVHVGVLTRADMELVAAMLRALARRVPGVRLALVGNARAPVPGDLLAAGVVQRTGWVSRAELHRWIAAADLCVVAVADTIGNRGRWPSKINDYFSCGRPVALPRVGDAAELVQEAGAGWAAEPEPGALADAIAAALADRAALEEAGLRARELAETSLAWPLLGQRLERFYRTVLERARAPSRRVLLPS